MNGLCPKDELQREQVVAYRTMSTNERDVFMAVLNAVEIKARKQEEHEEGEEGKEGKTHIKFYGLTQKTNIIYFYFLVVTICSGSWCVWKQCSHCNKND